MRLFTAIDLPNDMLERVGEFLARLRPLAELRWSPVENLHITTKFIGEWPERRIEEVKNALSGVPVPGPIEIAVRAIGWFPDARHPKVLWTGVEAGEPLFALARSTEQAVTTLGVRADERPYSPHLTLARASAPVPFDKVAKAAGTPVFGRFEASSFFLYLSLNGKYSKLAEYPLTL